MAFSSAPVSNSSVRVALSRNTVEAHSPFWRAAHTTRFPATLSRGDIYAIARKFREKVFQLRIAVCQRLRDCVPCFFLRWFKTLVSKYAPGLGNTRTHRNKKKKKKKQTFERATRYLFVWGVSVVPGEVLFGLTS